MVYMVYIHMYLLHWQLIHVHIHLIEAKREDEVDELIDYVGIQ